MTIYIATDTPMPTIPYDETALCLNTEDIVENEQSLFSVFTKPHLKYVGSDQGCGCGFRHVLLDGDQWLNAQNETEDIIDNTNHQNLVDFIVENNKGARSIEILSCWEGDQNELIRHFQTIGIIEILDESFYFKERALYTVQLKKLPLQCTSASRPLAVIVGRHHISLKNSHFKKAKYEKSNCSN